MTDLRYRNKLEIDVDGSLITPTIVLCTRSGKKIGVLQNVQGLKRSHPMNDVAEMSFDVYKYADGKKEPCWDSIKNFKLICLPTEPDNKYKWYEIAVNIDETTDTIKHVTCIHANEAELGQLMLYDVEINTEDDIARDDYETITIGDKEYGTVFYNPEHPKNSLLHRILADKASHYQIIHVDDTLKNIQREFSFNGTSIVDALNQTVAQEVQCLFVFGESLDKEETNEFQRTISAYDLLDYCEDCGERGSYSQGVCTHCGSTHIKSGYGKDTGIFINTENLTDSISFTSATDQVKNFFKMSAGDDDMTAAIRNCNPNGSAYLVYFSKEMQEDMSDELRARLNEYNTIYDSYLKTKVITLPSSDIDAYNNLINKYQKYSKEELPLLTSEIQGFNVLTNYDYNAVNFRDFLQTVMIPRSSEVVDTTAEEQIGLLTVDNMSPIGVEDYTAMSLTASNTAVKNYAKVYVDTSLYRIDISDSTYSNNEWSGTITLTSYTDEEDTASINLNIIFNNDGAVFLKQKIEKAMAQHKTEDIGDVSFLQKDISQIKSELVKYSLDSLSLLDDICSSVMDILAQAGQGEADSPYYSEFYYPYWQKRNAIMEEESVRENEIAVIEKVIEDIDSTRTDIINYLNMESFFGDLYPELMLYRRETEYSNTNFISDGLTDSEIIEKAQEFFKRAQEEIIKASTVQHSISGNLYNLFLIPEFRQITKDDSNISEHVFSNTAVEKFLRTFESGNWLRVRVDDEIYKLRMTNWEIDYDSPEQLDVEFSDVVYGNGTMSDIASLLSQARTMASSYDTVMRQAEKGNEANSSINKTKKQGLLLNQNKIISDINEQSFVIDSNGALMRAKNDFDDGYSNEQVKLLNKGIYYTNDSWETVKAGLGHFMYYDPETGTTKEDYGIIASTIVGQLLLGENLKIYSESGKFEMGDGGLKITAKNGEDNLDLFVIQKEKVDDQGRKYVEKYVYVDSNGDVKISGSSIVLGGKPLIEYIDEAIDDAEIDVSLPVTIQLDSSAGVIFRSKSISTNLTATVFKGGSDITSQITNFKWTKKDKYGVIDTSWTRETSSNTIAVSIDDIGEKVILVCEVSVTQDSATTVSQGSITITEVQDGADGVSPIVRSIICSHSAAVCEKDGVYNPDTIKFSGQALSDNNISDYEGWFVIELSSDSQNWVSNYSSSSKESFVNYKIPLGVNINKDGVLYYQGTAVTTNGAIISSDFTITSDGVITTTQGVGFIIRSIRCSLYSDSAKTNLIDQQRVNIAFDGVDGDKGDDGYTVILTNENHTFAGNTTSAVDGGFTECEVIAYRGAVRVPCHIGSITGCPVGMNIPVITNNDTNNAKFTISVTSLMTSQNGTLNIPVTVDDKLFNMKFTYSLKLNGLDSVGLGWMINHSTPTVSNDGECIYYGFDDVTKEPSFTSDGWVLWNGQKVVIPHGCYINPDQTMPYNTTIYSVYRLPSPTTYTNGIFHDVAWVENTNSWRSNTYNGNTPTVDTSSWVWNEDTDIILAMYVEPSNEGAITNAQLFTPPKKYSELVEVAKGMAKDAEKVATNYLSVDESGIMIADLSNGSQTPLQATGRNVFINNTSVNIRDGQSKLAVFGGDGITLGKNTDKNIEINNDDGIDIRNGAESLANFNDTVRIGKIVYDRPYATVDNQGMNILISRGMDTRKLISLGALYDSNMNENMGYRIDNDFTYTLLNEPTTGSNISLTLVYHTVNPTPTIINCFTQGVATSRTSTTAPSVILDYVDIDGTSYPCGYLDYDGDRTFTYVANNPISISEPTGEINDDGEEEYADVEVHWTSFMTPTVFYSTGNVTSGGYITNGTRTYNTPIGGNTLTNGTELIASSNDQIVVGRYNEADSGDENAIIVGDGNSEQRHNSFTVGRGGNVFAAGGLDVAGNITQGGVAVSLQGHNHNASDITMGKLPIAMGGSGNSGTYSTATISNICTAASGWSVTQAQYCSWGKVATIHIVVTKNSTAASAGYQTICTLVEGKRPKFSSPALKGWHDGAIVNTDGTIQFSDSVAANEDVQIRATYVLA